MDKNAYAESLIKLGEFIKDSELDMENANFSSVTVYVFCDSKESFAKNTTVLGGFTKSADDAGTWVNANKPFGQHSLQVTIERQKVCEKVKIGTKVILAKPETVIPASPEKEEDIYEYKCPESFLGMGKVRVAV